jgi:hypothetical protein
MSASSSSSSAVSSPTPSSVSLDVSSQMASTSSEAPRWSFFFFMGMALLPIWVPKYLPMTDLPQHAAQIALWMRYHDPAYNYSEVYDIRLFTPYLLGYFLVRLLASVFPLWVALKLVLSGAVIGFAYAFRALLRVRGWDEAWGWAAFALAYHYAFYWGFFNYVIALPLGMAYLAWIARRVENPEGATRFIFFLTTLGLFFAHGMIFAICGVSSALWVMSWGRGLRDRVMRGVPFAGAAMVAVLWVLWAGQGAQDAPIPSIYKWGLWRLVELPALSLGYAQDIAGWVVGAFFLALLSFSASWVSWRAAIPLMVWGVVYMVMPHDWRNVAFLYPRLGILLWPCLFLACKPRGARLGLRSQRLVLGGLVLSWLFLVFVRFLAFDRDARDIDPLFSQMPPNIRTMYFPLERGTSYLGGGAPFLYQGLWHEVNTGGYSAFSFAHTSVAVVHWRANRRPKDIQGRDGWSPAFFRNPSIARDFDAFLIRHPQPVGHLILARSPVPICFVARSGSFWLYRRAPLGVVWLDKTGKEPILRACSAISPPFR